VLGKSSQDDLASGQFLTLVHRFEASKGRSDAHVDGGCHGMFAEGAAINTDCHIRFAIERDASSIGLTNWFRFVISVAVVRNS